MKIWKTGGKITDKNFTRVEMYEEQARRYYAERLIDDSDIYLISQNTGFSTSDIRKIKNHMMRDMIPFEDGIRRFDPDIDQALAWKRLIDGNNIRDTDILLLRHELEELSIMNSTGVVFEKAHPLANKKYDWQTAIQGFIDYDELY